jgi:hypothetical protein
VPSCPVFSLPIRCGAAGNDVGERGQAELDCLALAAQGRLDLGELVLGAGEADLEALDLAGPAFALGLGDAVVQVVPDLLEPAALGGVWSQERASDTGLTEMILVTYPDRCGVQGVPVLTAGDWQESWFAAAVGVSPGMAASFQSWAVR